MVTSVGAMGGNRPLDQLRSTGTAAKAAVPEAKDDAVLNAPISASREMAEGGVPIDFAKVAKIKAAIASGTYKADPTAIADKMIKLDLPTKK